jgi:hypothetical protein
VLDVAQVLGCGVGERRAGPDHAAQAAAARLVEDITQPDLGQALGELADRRPPALSPGRF